MNNADLIAALQGLQNVLNEVQKARGGIRGDGGFGVTAHVVARNPCPDHHVTHTDADTCKGGIVGSQ